MSHAIERTSPKGPGQKFIGRCVKCGRDGLGIGDGLKDCPADAVMSDEAALLSLIEPPASKGDRNDD
jgi:hypothetical protein